MRQFWEISHVQQVFNDLNVGRMQFEVRETRQGQVQLNIKYRMTFLILDKNLENCFYLSGVFIPSELSQGKTLQRILATFQHIFHLRDFILQITTTGSAQNFQFFACRQAQVDIFVEIDFFQIGGRVGQILADGCHQAFRQRISTVGRDFHGAHLQSWKASKSCNLERWWFLIELGSVGDDRYVCKAWEGIIAPNFL